MKTTGISETYRINGLLIVFCQKDNSLATQIGLLLATYIKSAVWQLLIWSQWKEFKNQKLLYSTGTLDSQGQYWLLQGIVVQIDSVFKSYYWDEHSITALFMSSAKIFQKICFIRKHWRLTWYLNKKPVNERGVTSDSKLL